MNSFALCVSSSPRFSLRLFHLLKSLFSDSFLWTCCFAAEAEKALLQSDNKSLAQKVQTLQNEVTQLQIRSPTQDQAPKQAPFNAEAEIQSLKQNVEYLERLLNGLVGKYYAVSPSSPCSPTSSAR